MWRRMKAVDNLKKVYMIRHGQSIWNHDSKFTGWTNIPLTDNGRKEAKIIANTLINNEIYPNVFFSSVLQRAIDTSNIIKKEFKMHTHNTEIRTYTSWRLNERHYGSLEGVPRQYIRDAYGDKFTEMMRSNFYMKPPVLKDIQNKVTDYKIYRNCYYNEKKNGESKEDVYERLMPYFQNDIMYTLSENMTPIIVTHKHCARVLMKYLLKLDDEGFENYNIKSKHIYELIFNMEDEFMDYKEIPYN